MQTHALSVLINHCSIPDSTRRLHAVCGKRLQKFCLWDSRLCATSRSVKLHIMQMHCLLFMWQYQGMKASGDRGLWQVTKRDGGGREREEAWERENKLCDRAAKAKWRMTLLLRLSRSLLLRWQTVEGCTQIKAHHSERERGLQPSNFSASASPFLTCEEMENDAVRQLRTLNLIIL